MITNDIDKIPFPNVSNSPFCNEFHIGNMLPMMGSTKGFDSELSRKSIEELIEDDNEEMVVEALSQDDKDNHESNIDKRFTPMKDLTLSSYKKIPLTNVSINRYSRIQRSLSKVRINRNTQGYLFIDNQDVPVAVINVEEKDDGNWIQAFEIFGRFKGHGMAKDLLDIGTKTLNGNKATVNKNNQLAHKIYKDYGFQQDNISGNLIYMSIGNVENKKEDTKKGKK